MAEANTKLERLLAKSANGALHLLGDGVLAFVCAFSVRRSVLVHARFLVVAM
jgi:hypothetical protein